MTVDGLYLLNAVLGHEFVECMIVNKKAGKLPGNFMGASPTRNKYK